MDNTREKLIDLLGGDVCKGCYCEDCEHENNEKACIEHIKSRMADHLIANRVTFQEYDCHWATEQAYKNGYEQGKKDAAKWIPVTERLPEQTSRCLVARWDYVTDKPFIDILWFEKGIWWNRLHVGNYAVTHWMPLPEPPKEEL